MPSPDAGRRPAWTLLVCSLALMMSFLDALVEAIPPVDTDRPLDADVRTAGELLTTMLP